MAVRTWIGQDLGSWVCEFVVGMAFSRMLCTSCRETAASSRITERWCSAEIADPAQGVLAEGMETRSDVSMVACLASVAG